MRNAGGRDGDVVRIGDAVFYLEGHEGKGEDQGGDKA